jgi:hypothetical protein
MRLSGQHFRVNTYSLSGDADFQPKTPAMAAGITKRLLEMKDVVDMIEAWEAAHACRTKRQARRAPHWPTNEVGRTAGNIPRRHARA